MNIRYPLFAFIILQRLPFSVPAVGHVHFLGSSIARLQHLSDAALHSTGFIIIQAPLTSQLPPLVPPPQQLSSRPSWHRPRCSTRPGVRTGPARPARPASARTLGRWYRACCVPPHSASPAALISRSSASLSICLIRGRRPASPSPASFLLCHLTTVGSLGSIAHRGATHLSIAHSVTSLAHEFAHSNTASALLLNLTRNTRPLSFPKSY